MAPKILIVLTSQDRIPANNQPTGWYLPEFAHPWDVLHQHAELVIVSPAGGVAPIDPSSVKASENDPVSTKFFNEQKTLWEKTETLADFLPRVAEFDALFYVGGHGPMFDLYSDPNSIALIEAFAAAKKPVSAVCHGPAVFLNTKTPSGTPLIASAQVTGFSNTEENQMNMSSLMPFSLEDELNRLSGGQYVKADQPWGAKVAVSKTAELGGPLITGQNPASATGVGKALLSALGL